MAQHYCHCDPIEVETKIFKIYGKMEEADVRCLRVFLQCLITLKHIY